jgi:hypothetical protein
LVGEHEPVGHLGIMTSDPEPTEVVGSVVAGAERDEVVWVGRTAVAPVLQGFSPPGRHR